tara:strand:+ start:9422 stop:11218 length:1797 start_codon:yes stop_codon:yes gene_type:complete
MLLIRKQIYNHAKIAISNVLLQEFPKEESNYPIDPKILTATKAEFGDYQINDALPLGKKLKIQPRDLAEKIVAQLNIDKDFLKICSPAEIAGPGFINLRLLERTIKNQFKLLANTKNDINKNKKENRKYKVIVDFSSPNIAKEMHVGHLRSTIIGDSIARILEFQGYKVLRINHVGDWGTQFGMLVAYLKQLEQIKSSHQNSYQLSDLVDFYKQAKKKFDQDEIFRNESRKEVIKLQNGDKYSREAWMQICEKSRKEYQEIYARLDIKITERGESFYNNLLESIISELEELNLISHDQGAKCIFLDGVVGKEGNPLPVIVQKSDGGFNYATTDLAAIKYRFNNPPKGDGANRLIYVTDAGQSTHFENIFKIAKLTTWIPYNCILQHVPFGLVQGQDGKKLKTRSGETIRLKDLLDEAVERAKKDLQIRLKEENRTETTAFIENVSNTIGYAAVKYADLSQNRCSNYQFNFDKMLSMQGNTAPYLLYALVRISGISRKGGGLNLQIETLEFTEPQEWLLIKQVLKFDEVVEEVTQDLLPNRLCNYLFELSQLFNRFYDQVPVLKSDNPYKMSRLVLCRVVAENLRTGMDLLGIPTLERM